MPMSEPVDTAALRALAEAAFDANGGIPMWRSAEFIEDRGWMDRADAEFVEATKPAVVIALCDEINSLRSDLARMKAAGRDAAEKYRAEIARLRARAESPIPDNIMALINSAAAEIANREVEAERQRANSWMDAGNKLYEIRNALRVADDTPVDHSRFFDYACRIVFGPTGDEDGGVE